MMVCSPTPHLLLPSLLPALLPPTSCFPKLLLAVSLRLQLPNPTPCLLGKTFPFFFSGPEAPRVLSRASSGMGGCVRVCVLFWPSRLPLSLIPHFSLFAFSHIGTAAPVTLHPQERHGSTKQGRRHAAKRLNYGAAQRPYFRRIPRAVLPLFWGGTGFGSFFGLDYIKHSGRDCARRQGCGCVCMYECLYAHGGKTVGVYVCMCV